MYCKNCGTRLDDDAKFCPNCGVKVSEDIPINNTPTYGNNAAVYVYTQNLSRINGFSIAGFVLSFFWFLAILGLIFSILGYRQAIRENTSKGLAIAGIALSSVCIAFWVIIIVMSAMMSVV